MADEKKKKVKATVSVPPSKAPAKVAVKTSLSDLENKLKGEIFKRMTAVKREAPTQPRKDQMEEMRDFMRDPFGTKEWARSKQVKKAKKEPVMVFDLVDLTPDELAEAQQKGEFAGFSE